MNEANTAATAMKKRMVTGETKGVTCIVCRSAKVRCDGLLPCGRCTRLCKICKPPGPCQRGKWQTERALIRQKAKKRKKTKSTACPTTFTTIFESVNIGHQNLGDETFHFGIVYLTRTLIAKGILHNNWEYFASASRLASKIGVPVKDVFFGSKQENIPTKNIVSNLQSKLLEQATHTVPSPPVISWTNVPDAVAKACDMDIFNEPKERWTLAIQKIQGQSTFYMSPSFAKDVMSMEELTRLGDVGFYAHLFPKKELPQVSKRFAEGFSLYTRKDSPPVCITFASTIILKNKTMKEVVVKTCLYIEESLKSTWLCEFVPREKRNDWRHPPGPSNSSADERKDANGESMLEFEALEDIDLSLMDSTETGFPPSIISESILQVLSEWS